ncbi:MAG: acyl carrier protein [Clostridia bacterium]|nr:acyl carrier protein [Clostridia bacterium]
MNIFDTVCTILKEQLEIDESVELSEATLLDELDADSLDVIEVVMALEDGFDIEFSDEEAETVRSVGDLVEVISSKL